MNCHSVWENNRKKRASKEKSAFHAAAYALGFGGPRSPQSRRENQTGSTSQRLASRIDWMGDKPAQNTHRNAEAAKVSKLCFAASSSLCVMLTHSAIFNVCFELEAFSPILFIL
jgi:hypothetical protein